MLYVLAGTLNASLAGMLTTWALHTSFALSCMYKHLRNLLTYETDSSVSHRQVGGRRFLCMSRNSSSAAYMAVSYQFRYLPWFVNTLL